MVLSLQDQLKKSGLIDEKKAKQLKRAKNKEAKLARKGKTPVVDERKLALEQRKAEQAEKDRQLNHQKNAKALNTAIKAQIKQLIATNEIKQSGEKKYSFADGSKIKNLWIEQKLVDQLSAGHIVIVRSAEKFALVPARVAEKIEQRDPAAIVFRAEKSAAVDEDDPYADYQIPDDLDW